MRQAGMHSLRRCIANTRQTGLEHDTDPAVPTRAHRARHRVSIGHCGDEKEGK